LALEDGKYIIDPMSGIDVKSLLKEVSKTDIILHGGDYDLRMLLADFDFRPERRIYDTMLGAELLGIESIGLAAVVEHFFDEPMCKAGQKSNWTKRPLTKAQLLYAVMDVVYLKELRDKIAGELEKLGRLQWWIETNERLVERSGQSKEKGDKDPWRIKGSRELMSSQLRYLRSLWNWRNDIAEKLDRPVFKIVGNDVLIRLSMWLEDNPGKNPKKFNRLPKICRGSNFDMLCDYIKSARKLEKDKWPSHKIKRQKFWVEPDKQLIEIIRDFIKEKAETLNLKPQLLLTRAQIEAITRAEPKSVSQIAVVADLMDWQKRLFASELLGILAEYSVENDVGEYGED
jgi:ribonuclease D